MLHIYEKVPSKMSTIIVAFDAGARAEHGKFSPGIAHMLEHMMFKGTEKRDYLDIPREISFLGGDVNAFTSQEMVAYYIMVPVDNLEPAMEILSDMVFNSTFPEEEFIKEKEVVLEEEASSNDNIYPYIMKTLTNEFFTGRLADPVIGTQETISGFTHKELKKFHKKFYSSSNAIVTLVSNISKRNAKQLMTKYFGRSSRSLKTKVPMFEPAYARARTVNIHRPQLEHSYVFLAYPGFTVNSGDEVAMDILMEIYGQGMDSRLFTEVREKNALCYSIGASSSSYRDQGIVMVHSSTRAENVDKMLELVRKETGLIKTEPVTAEEIQKAKNQHKADTYKMLESSSYLANWSLSRSFFGQGTLEEYDKKVNEITAEDIMEVANKYFDESRELTLICSTEE